MASAKNLRAVVEVVPVVAGAHPVVVGGGVVGLVVGVGRGVVELAGLGVLAGGLGVEGSSGLAVESLPCNKTKIKNLCSRTTTSLSSNAPADQLCAAPLRDRKRAATRTHTDHNTVFASLLQEAEAGASRPRADIQRVHNIMAPGTSFGVRTRSTCASF